jgi:hypothetical protein
MSASIPERFAIMARLGPEDTLEAVPLGSNSSPLLTAGRDWAITRGSAGGSPAAGAPAAAAPALHYKDFAEAERLAAVAEGGGAGARVLRDLQAARNICAQPRFAFELCRASFRAHQLKQCAPAYVEKLKCDVKLLRAVDTLCRPQMAALTACLGGDGAARPPSECLKQLTAFDMCTEDW